MKGCYLDRRLGYFKEGSKESRRGVAVEGDLGVNKSPLKKMEEFEVQGSVSRGEK